MARVVCVDYEGALARRDVPAAIFERFADESWRTLRAEWQRGFRSRESYLAEALRSIEAPADEVVPFATETAELERGLTELWDWAHWNDWFLVVLADGFDFYVEPSLAPLGLPRLPRHCARTTTRYRWRAQYFSPRGIEIQARFKLSYVAAYRAAGDFVVYLGAEGAPEAAAAAHAAIGRARGDLHFVRLEDVVGILERQGEAWWRSWCSTTAGEASSNSSPEP
ncbi:2-hydroxy-3-keto-5-methylthiopentenyl-1-phosphate phosphatase [bacterium HR29]|jgi:hypothetical protein|nr:2-hydroxy-3-keto-5-methylthiopentenyl-1-phosphate phosphatase [bacterium HR29]